MALLSQPDVYTGGSHRRLRGRDEVGGGGENHESNRRVFPLLTSVGVEFNVFDSEKTVVFFISVGTSQTGRVIDLTKQR